MQVKVLNTGMLTSNPFRSFVVTKLLAASMAFPVAIVINCVFFKGVFGKKLKKR